MTSPTGSGAATDGAVQHRQAKVAAWQAIRDMVTNHLTSRRAEVVERLGLSFIKAKALQHLVSGPLTMGELTALLGTDPPYTSVVVGDLVARRLAFRTAHPSDRRRKVIDLTPAGCEMADLAQQILDRPPSDFDGLAFADLVHLQTLFPESVGATLTRA